MRPGRRYSVRILAEHKGLSKTGASRALRISGSEYKAYWCHGVTRKVAERMADQNGVHPYEVWPEMADHDFEDASVPCANDRCEKRLIPRTTRQRYCSRQCAKNAWMRQHYASDSDWRERRLADNRQRYEQTKDEIAAARQTPSGRRYIARMQRVRYQSNEATRERRKAAARAYKARKRAEREGVTDVSGEQLHDGGRVAS
jgi:hypothetical protein